MAGPGNPFDSASSAQGGEQQSLGRGARPQIRYNRFHSTRLNYSTCGAQGGAALSTPAVSCRMLRNLYFPPHLSHAQAGTALLQPPLHIGYIHADGPPRAVPGVDSSLKSTVCWPVWIFPWTFSLDSNASDSNRAIAEAPSF